MITRDPARLPDIFKDDVRPEKSSLKRKSKNRDSETRTEPLIKRRNH